MSTSSTQSSLKSNIPAQPPLPHFTVPQGCFLWALAFWIMCWALSWFDPEFNRQRPEHRTAEQVEALRWEREQQFQQDLRQHVRQQYQEGRWP